MTEVHKEQTDAFMSKKELMFFLVPHFGELKGNLEELRSNVEGRFGGSQGFEE
jgi:hypothetical protein